MNAGDEYTLVEAPLMATLAALGWATLDGDPDAPALVGRASFRETILTDRLAAAVRRVNTDDAGREWLDDGRVRTAVNGLLRVSGTDLLARNREAFRLMLEGVEVEGLNGERGTKARLIDFDHAGDPDRDRNEYLAVRQFRVEGHRVIVPDVVLFVNGIPLVVVECKSPATNDPVGAGIEQLRRYTNCRGELDGDEGAEGLFTTNQLLVATSGDRAAVGTVGAGPKHYAGWLDVAPRTVDAVKAELGVTGELSGQQILAAGLLRPGHLLDVIRNFVLFKADGARVVKIAPRYPQFRAVHTVIDRLRTGQTREQNGDHDARGGLVWHTQGSGKSLTMTFLVRKLRTLPDLRRFKVVVVTDRTQLQGQLAGTADLSGDVVLTATSVADLQGILRQAGPALVFAMIQKLRGPADDGVLFPVLNESSDILVLVDEAHRSHGRGLHANLRRALPNAAVVGFTGTPIVEADKKQTEAIFGPFLDTYTIRQSEADGATLPIRYEGWETRGVVIDGQTIDGLFDEYFADKTADERAAIQAKYANRFKILEAQDLIAAKAGHMLRHYVENVLPRGLKAQVVAVSRLSAVRYQHALAAGVAELVRRLDDVPGHYFDLPEEAVAALPDDDRLLHAARPHLETLRRIEVAAVISGDPHDPAAWAEWTDPAKIRQRAGEEGWFKTPLVADCEGEQHGLAILCVKGMLLTGFDAPVEQALYLDRPMKGAELLQAIARVNRTYSGKGCGLVVDYCGVAKNLAAALAAYTDADRAGVMRRLLDDLPTLEDYHRDVLAVFGDRGLDIHADREECVNLLDAVPVRADFTVKLTPFLDALDTLLPRPEGLAFTRDARQLGLINLQARNRTRDGRLDLGGAGPRVRALIDRHVRAAGIDPTIPPVSVLDVAFPAAVQACGSPRAMAAEMEHAARHHITVHAAEDPAHYRALSERLEDILRTFRDDWDALVDELMPFVADLRRAEARDVPGLEPRQAPFYRLLADQFPGCEVPAGRQDAVKAACRGLCAELRDRLGRVDFWRTPTAQVALRGWVFTSLDALNLFDYSRLPALADAVVATARANHARLTA